ncbi:tubulin domain-containing protein [Scheffersomyces amazonensis]|uniref:tubulin domain-containing protein n=1 Tax=Scheffersomyces amazonensis TaxID=1078765 RepID=UPI00315CAB3A
MSEILSISLSQPSNHVITHLYNTQESHIPYTKKAPVNYTNGVFLSTSLQNGYTNYSPRAIIYDLQGGFGSLSKYEYHDPKNTFNNISQSHQLFTNTNVSIIPKNQYQLNLDKGITEQDLLTTSNTKYWSDYNKLIYTPKSLNTIPNFKHNSQSYGYHKNFENLKFDNFKVGSDEFSTNLDYVDNQIDNFRYHLEKCDSLQGINIISELNSGWSGYTNEFLTTIIDEYFNSNHKNSIWLYGLISSRNIDTSKGSSKLLSTISQIKSLIELNKNCSLFFPINMNQIPSNSNALLNDNYDNESLWHSASISSLFINSIWGINNQSKNSTSMSIMEDMILRGYENRKIINEIKLNNLEYPQIGLSHINNLISNVDISNYYNEGISPQQASLTSSESLELSVPSFIPNSTNYKSSTKYFIKNYIVPEDHKEIEKHLIDDNEGNGIPKNLFKNRDMNDILKVETFPSKILKSQDKFTFYSEFNINTNLKQDLKSYQKLIRNIHPSRIDAMEILDDKAELIEDIDYLIEQYTIDYELSDESDDDDI